MNPALDSRARFEATMRDQFYGGLACPSDTWNGDHYTDFAHHMAWKAWQAAIASMWVPVEERLPEPGKAVLLDIGEPPPIRALWAAKHTIEADLECPEDCAEYDEATDTYYVPSGWYEWNRHEEAHWFVHATARAWCELPTPQDPPIAAPSRQEP